MKKKYAIVCVILLCCILLSACDGTKETPDIRGTQQNWGNISVFVPEGYQLHGGAIVGSDTNNPDQCSIQPEKQDALNYYWIIATTADKAENNIDSSKSINNADDITVQVGDQVWKGCHYLYKPLSGKNVDCGALYCTVGKVTYQVNFAGHAPESKEMSTVLASIQAV